MKLTINQKGEFILEEVYNSIRLVNGNEVIHLSMRDGVFELSYKGDTYSIKDGKIKKISDVKENSLLLKLKLYHNYKIDQKNKIIFLTSIQEGSEPILEELKRYFNYILQQEIIFDEIQERPE
jgi:hypothetical protein